MYLKCPKCQYIWDYTGTRDVATCPACFYSVRHLDECEVDQDTYITHVVALIKGNGGA